MGWRSGWIESRSFTLPSQRMKKANLLLPGLLLLLFVLFFIDGQHIELTRSFRIAWNLGHVVFFAFVVFLLLQHTRFLHEKSQTSQISLVLGICLIAGIFIESIQFFIGRQASWIDILRNMLGGMSALIFSRHAKMNQSRLFGPGSKVIIFVLLCSQLYPLLRALADEQMARSDFPLLADFESQLELDRWRSNGGMNLDKSIKTNGDSSVRIQLTTEKYSGASLKYFPGNWKDFNRIMFSIYLPDLPPLPLTIRIHDQQHEQNDFPYSDRFHLKTILQKGWNHVSIDIKQVIQAPKTRSMDIESIANIHFFAIGLRQPRVIYLDNLRLQ